MPSSILIKDFRCVVDIMLLGMRSYLRMCNADVLEAETNDSRAAVSLALETDRFLLTSGSVYTKNLSRFAEPWKCVYISDKKTSLDQFKDLITKYRLVIKSKDLFVRCPLCNTTPFVTLSSEEFSLHKSKYLVTSRFKHPSISSCESKLAQYKVTDSCNVQHTIPIDFPSFVSRQTHPSVDKYFVCTKCGHIYWDGCHTSSFIESMKSYIVDEWTFTLEPNILSTI